MVDTFTCDSCGKNNVPTTDKKQLLLKEVQVIAPATQTTKEKRATVTIGMEICPECKTLGVIKNHVKVSKEGEPERTFTWNPRSDMQNVYEWGQKKAEKKD